MADSESLPMQGPPEPPAHVPSMPPNPGGALNPRPARWSDPVIETDRERQVAGAAPPPSTNPMPWMSVPPVGAAPPPPPPPRRPVPATIPSAHAPTAVAPAVPVARPSGAAVPPAGVPTNTTRAGNGAGAAQPAGGAKIPVARPAAGAVAPQDAPKQKHDESLEERAYREAPSWLISAVVHMIGLIILGLIFAVPKLTQTPVAELDATFADQLGVQMFDPSITSGEFNSPDATKMMITPTDLQPVEDPFAAPRQPEISLDGSSAIADLQAPTIGLALSGRQTGSRQMLLGRYGGNRLTEAGVQLGLQWLAAQQQKDGSWSLKGPYTGGARNENRESATAMALLAFQGNGNTHKVGNYKKNVAAGIGYLLKAQGPDGNFYQGERSNQWLYTQAQCTIAICELYGMSKDSSLRTPAEMAINFCIEAQSPEGGWRYRPRMDSDTSVTGWVVMALQSARMAGIEVPKKTLDRVGLYLDSASDNGGALYGYQAAHAHDQVMTAEALLCRQYLGWSHYDPKLVQGVEYVLSHLPNWSDRDVYYWYYGTQVMHHMGGDYWKKWNDAFRDMLVEHQEKSGPEKGSWNPLGDSPDAWCVRYEGGRLYCTCLSIYMLEVYYRHLPIYGHLAGER